MTGPDLPTLLEAVADALDLEADGLDPTVRLVDCCRDSLDLYCVLVVADGWLPGFELPRQLDLEVATLGDLHHYLVTRLAQQAADR